MLLDFLSTLRPMFRDEEILMVLSPEDVRDPELGIEDGYTFDIFLRKPRRRIGYVSLRMGESPALYYLGHIGYRIDAPYRGHGYAARACRIGSELSSSLCMRA